MGEDAVRTADGGVRSPAVGVVVLTWNGRDLTLDCLRSLLQCTYPSFCVYVVDNASEDGTLEAVETEHGGDPRVVAIQNGENLGFAEGNNVGTRRAIADGMDYVLLLNNDTEVDPEFLAPLVEAMEADPNIGVTTSMIYFHGTDRQIWSFGVRMDRNTGVGMPIGGREVDRGQFRGAIECDYATGCGLMVRRDVVKKIGYLDPDYFYLAEDADYCFRAADAGYRVFAIPTSIIWHKVTASLKGGEEAPMRLYFRARNRLLLVKKAQNKDHALQGWLTVVAGEAAYIARRVVLGRFRLKGTLYYLWGILDFLRGRFGPPPWHETSKR